MTILYLYAELMGYQIPVLKEYVSEYKADVHIVHWDDKKLTPYVPPALKGVTYYSRSTYNYNKLNELVKKINPDIVYVSGWMDNLYLKVCRVLKNKNIPIVAGCDTQWRGSFKQKLGVIYFKIFLRKNFDYLWVAGPYQYEYAKKLGFKNIHILFNCLTADTDLFQVNRMDEMTLKHNFLYVGRLEDKKGLRILMKAWREIEEKKDWTLTLIGNGSLRDELGKEKNLIIKDFLQPELLVKEFKNSGCFVLPSLKEPWALVIHEAVSASLPIIASDVCGAAPIFITSNYNGFVSKSGSYLDLKENMIKIIKMSDEELFKYSLNSYEKSKIISAKIVAASFMSILK